MSVLFCPRCRRTNPEPALFCYFDGEALRPGLASQAHRLPVEFTFPSGRRCQTYDELAQGCQEEWASARELLQRGMLSSFFASCGRADLARVADEVRNESSPDVALSMLVSSLPGLRAQQLPKLDLQPRRMLLGTLMAGEVRKLQLTVSNVGQGVLQGSITVTEGHEWLTLGGLPGGRETTLHAEKQQLVALTADTKGLTAAQPHAAKLTIVSNGGAAEVPLRLEIAAQPFAHAPFQGARTLRELAEKMRVQPKLAVPVLENGSILRWCQANGWTYPIAGPEVKGIAAVQQFFEGLGLSTPPKLQLSPSEMNVHVANGEATRHQVVLQSPTKKWVYALISSDQPWLVVQQPQVTGPQQAPIHFHIEPRLLPDAVNVGHVQVVANGGQKLQLRVHATQPAGKGAKRATRVSPAQPAGPAQPASAVPVAAAVRAAPAGGAVTAPRALVALALLFFLFRLAMIPLADLWARPQAVQAAARIPAVQATASPVALEASGAAGAWLALPWLEIITGAGGTFSARLLGAADVAIKFADFGNFFTSAFLARLIAATAWVGGAGLGAWVWRRTRSLPDSAWAVVAGLGIGAIASTSLGAVFLIVEALPLRLWQLTGLYGSAALFLWVLLALLLWTGLGAAFGFMGVNAPIVGPLVVTPAAQAVEQLFRLVGLYRGPPTPGK